MSRADGPDQRVWTVRIGTQLFWLAYEDFANRGVPRPPKQRRVGVGTGNSSEAHRPPRNGQRLGV